MKKNILFVDPRVTYYQFHVDALNPQTDAWYLLEAHLDGVSQMAAIVKTYDHLESIQILSYVEANTMLLGSSLLNEQQLDAYELPFKKIGARLANTGKIILGLYGATNNAKNKRGIKSTFVNHLSLLLNNPVSVFTASDESKELTLSLRSFKHAAPSKAQASFTIPPEVLAEISASVDDLINANQARPHQDNASFDNLQYKQQPFDQQYLDAYVKQNALNHWSVKPLTIAVAMTFSSTALSEPTGGQVTAGQATINQAGAVTTINQTTQKAAIDWQTFNVKSHEAVNFNQPNASAITLNRVTGTESSTIMGSITANGKVFILNPNGVLIGAGAQVNVGGMVASTLNISNQDFLNDNFSFKGIGSGTVENNGNINIAEGGMLALIAPVVKNNGTINAPQGDVLLAAADDVTLTLQDGSLTSFTLNKGSVQTLINNGGLIQADGGHVVLTAKGVDALSKSVINHTGIIEAQTVSSKDGKIELLGDMKIGELNVAGKLDASAPTNGDGGFVETSAAKVNIAANTQVTTKADSGNNGTWLIDPTDFNVNAGNGAQTTSGIGATTLSTNLNNGNVTIETSSAGAGNGDINVNNAISWTASNYLTLKAHRNININATIEATGTNAGLELFPSLGGAGNYFINGGGKVTLSGNSAVFNTDGISWTLIHNLNDLQNMNNGLAAAYALGNDIDAAATSGWNGGTGFQPIGSYPLLPYSGTFNGLGHVVSNLFINRPDHTWLGLFGYVTGNIYNVGVENANITAAYSSHSGILAGDTQGIIRSSYSTGVISSIGGGGSTGGLVGSVGLTGQIYESYSTADVNASHAVGGLVGFHNGVIENSYATGDITNNEYVAGGLVGIHNGVINNSYSTGNSTGTGSVVGGLVSYKDRDRVSTTTNSYWDTQTSGLLVSASGTGKTTTEMQQKATYAGWDFDNVWRISPGDYPRLRALTQGSITIGTGTIEAQARNAAKVYDKTPWTGGLIDYSGFIDGDTINTIPLVGQIQWVGSAEGAVNVGQYDLTPTGLSFGGAYAQKYDIQFNSGTLFIVPRILDVAVTKNANGNATFNSGFNLINNRVITGDVVNVTGTVTVASANEGVYNSFVSNNLVTDNPNYTVNPVNTDDYVYAGTGQLIAIIKSTNSTSGETKNSTKEGGLAQPLSFTPNNPVTTINTETVALNSSENPFINGFVEEPIQVKVMSYVASTDDILKKFNSPVGVKLKSTTGLSGEQQSFNSLLKYMSDYVNFDSKNIENIANRGDISNSSSIRGTVQSYLFDRIENPLSSQKETNLNLIKGYFKDLLLQTGLELANSKGYVKDVDRDTINKFFDMASIDILTPLMLALEGESPVGNDERKFDKLFAESSLGKAIRYKAVEKDTNDNEMTKKVISNFSKEWTKAKGINPNDSFLTKLRKSLKP